MASIRSENRVDFGGWLMVACIGGFLGSLLVFSALEGAGILPNFSLMESYVPYTARTAIYVLLAGQALLAVAGFAVREIWKLRH